VARRLFPALAIKPSTVELDLVGSIPMPLILLDNSKWWQLTLIAAGPDMLRQLRSHGEVGVCKKWVIPTPTVSLTSTMCGLSPNFWRTAASTLQVAMAQ